VLTDEQAKEELRSIEAKLLGRGDSRELRDAPWPRWKMRSRFPYRELILRGRAGVLDFDERTQRQFSLLTLQ
jgi:hypothetical protein